MDFGSYQKPLVLFKPLPVIKVPWTHIGMNFVPDLPPSLNCMVIWVVVDRFSKMAQVVPYLAFPLQLA